MAQARVVVLNETKKARPDGYTLCFQYCRFEYGNGTEENGYRFIWRRPNNNLIGARGQARLASVPEIMILVSQALKEGWGCYNCDTNSIEYEDE